jgi:hypothetical protein
MSSQLEVFDIDSFCSMLFNLLKIYKVTTTYINKHQVYFKQDQRSLVTDVLDKLGYSYNHMFNRNFVYCSPKFPYVDIQIATINATVLNLTAVLKIDISNSSFIASHIDSTYK